MDLYNFKINEEYAKKDYPIRDNYNRQHQEIKLNTVLSFCRKKEVLELGCGWGYFIVALANKVKNIYGLDFSIGMLRLTQNKIRKNNLKNTYLICADIETLPLKKKFDVIFSFSTLDQIENVGKVLSSLSPILKNEGVLIIELSNYNSLSRYLSNFEKIKNYLLPVKEMNRLVSENGFEIISHRKFKILPMYGFFPTFWHIVSELLAKHVLGKSLDEIISSLPLLHNFAYKHIFVLRKTVT